MKPYLSLVIAPLRGRPALTFALAAYVMAAALTSATAAPIYWEPTGTTGSTANGTWTTAASTIWSTDSTGVAAPSTSWVSGSDAVFSDDTSDSALSTITMGSAISANSVTFGNAGVVGGGAAGGFTFTNANALSLGATTGSNNIITLNSGAGPVTFQGQVNLSNGSPNGGIYVITQSSSSLLTFGGTLYANGGNPTLDITGAGTGGVTFNGQLQGNTANAVNGGEEAINVSGWRNDDIQRYGLRPRYSHNLGWRRSRTICCHGSYGSRSQPHGWYLQFRQYHLRQHRRDRGNIDRRKHRLDQSWQRSRQSYDCWCSGPNANPNVPALTYAGTISGLGGVTINNLASLNRSTGGSETFSGDLSFAGPFNINANLAALGTSGGNGSAGNDFETVTLSASNGMTGAINVTSNLGTATLVVNGAAGSVVNTSGITANGSVLTFDNTAGAANRIGATEGITLNANTPANLQAYPYAAAQFTQNPAGSSLNFLGNGTVSTTQTMGALTLGANSNDTISITSPSGQVTTLAASTLTRGAGATALIRGTALNQSSATTVSRLTLGDSGASLGAVGANTLSGGATNDATQSLAIVPYLFGDITPTGNGSNFVTYDSVLGLRVLTTSEETTLSAASTTAASPVDAIGFGGTVTTSGLTVNSLLFNTTAQTLNGSGALTVNSGAVAGAAATDTIGNGFSSLTLGNGEGVVTVVTNDALTVSTPINVTGGTDDLIKTGGGTLNIGAASAYTGPTYVNGGTLAVTAAGSISTPITIENTAAVTNAGSVGNVTVGFGSTFTNSAGTAGTVTNNQGTVSLTGGTTSAVVDEGAVTISGANPVGLLALSGTGSLGTLTYSNTLAAGNTVGIAAGTSSFATITNSSATGKLFLSPASNATVSIGTLAGAAGSITDFDGNANSIVTITSGSPMGPAGSLVDVSSGTVNVNYGRGTTANLEVDGGDLVYTSSADRLSLDTNNQTLKITGGELSVVTSGYGLRINGDNGADGAGGTNTTVTATQTGGLVLVSHGVSADTSFNLGNSTASANVTNYNLSGGILDVIGSGGVGTETGVVDIGADTTGMATSTLTLSGSAVLIASQYIQGAQGTGAKQAFVFNGGTLTTPLFTATNLTSTNGVAVSASTNTLNNNGGTLAPGLIAPVNGGGLTAGTQYTGKTAITGNYAVNSGSASLAINIGGATAAGGFGSPAADYDNVSVSGATTLGGNLNLNVINSYTPPAATNYNVLVGSASGVTGTFTNLVTATGGNSRVVLPNGLSSFLEAVNNTSASASIGGLTNVAAHTVAVGGYQATNSYTAASGNAWDVANAANWTNFDPGATANPATQASGAIAQFGDGGSTGSGPNIVTLNSTRNVQGLLFSSGNSGKNYTINNGGSGMLILDNSINNAPVSITDSSASGNTNTVNVPITLNSNLNVVVTNAANTVTIGAAIGSNGAGETVTLSGAGTLNLNGVNTYTGLTSVTGGQLNVNGSLAGGVTVSPGGSVGGAGTIGGLLTLNSGLSFINLENGAIGTLTLAGGLALNGGNQLDFDLGQGSSDSISITGGAYGFAGSSDTVSIASLGAITSGTYYLITGATGINQANFNLQTTVVNGFSLGLSATGGDLLLIATQLTGGGQAFWSGGIDSNWNTLVSGSSNFNTDQTSGINTGVLPSSTTDVYFTANGAKNYSLTTLGQNFAIHSLTFLPGIGTAAVGGSNSLTITSPLGITVNPGDAVTFNPETTVILGASQLWTNSSATPLTVASAVTDRGSGYVLTTSGTGVTILSGSNSYAGNILSSGELSVSSDLNLGGSNSLTFAGGVLQVTGTTLNNLNAHTLAVNSGITAGFDIANAGEVLNVTQNLNQGVGGLTKLGAGTLVLSGSNSYTGTTTLNGGVTQFAGTLAATPIVVNNNAIAQLGTALGLSSSNSIAINNTGGFDLNGHNFTSGQLTNSSTGANGITNSSATPVTLTLGGVTQTGVGSFITGPIAVSQSSGTNNSTYAGTFSNTGNVTFNINGSGNVTNNGVIANSGTVSITQTSTGVFTNNGSIANNGNLLLYSNNAGNGLNISGTLNNTGTISNLGTAGTTTISGVINSNVTQVIQNNTASQLTLSGPGGSMAGTISALAGTLNLAGSGGLPNLATLFINGATVNAGADNPNFSGGVTLASGTLNVTEGGNGVYKTFGGTGAAGSGAVINIGQLASNAPTTFEYTGGGNAGTLTDSFNILGTGTNNLINAAAFTGILNGGITLNNGNTVNLIFTIGQNSGDSFGSVSGTGNAVISVNTARTNGATYTSNVGGFNNVGTVTVGPSTSTQEGLNITGALGANVTSLIIKPGTTAFPIILSGASPNFAGTVVQTSGKVQFANATALNANNLVTLSGGSMDLNGQSVTIGGLSDGGTRAATFTNTSATVGTLTIGGSGTNSFGGIITASTPANLNLNVAGTATQVLTGVNGYAGTTTIGAGATLQLGNGTSGNDGTITSSIGITDNGLLIYDRAGSQTSGVAISGNGAVTIAGTGTQTLTAQNTYAGQTTINPGATLQLGNGTSGNDGSILNSTVVDNGTLIYNRNGAVTEPSMINGTGGVTVSGPGSETLEGVSNYTGPTTVNGTLIVSGGLNGTSAVTVNAGGTLEADAAIADGSVSATSTITLNGGTLEGAAPGSVGPIVAHGGVLAPGNGISPNDVFYAGVLAANGNVTLSGSTTFSIRLGVSSQSDNDQLQINGGTIALNGATLKLTNASQYVPGSNSGLTLIILNGGYVPGVSGTFSNPGGLAYVDGDYYQILYGYDPNANGGNGGVDSTGADIAIQFTAVPEPHTWVMMLLALGGLLAWQRARKGTARGL